MARLRISIGYCGCYAALITNSATFVVPENISRLQVLVVGGGASGGDGHAPGGAGGYVACGVFSVIPGAQIPVVVGSGGIGGVLIQSTPTAQHSGGSTTFGSLLAAGGGNSCDFQYGYITSFVLEFLFLWISFA